MSSKGHLAWSTYKVNSGTAESWTDEVNCSWLKELHSTMYWVQILGKNGELNCSLTYKTEFNGSSLSSDTVAYSKPSSWLEPHGCSCDLYGSGHIPWLHYLAQCEVIKWWSTILDRLPSSAPAPGCPCMGRPLSCSLCYKIFCELLVLPCGQTQLALTTAFLKIHGHHSTIDQVHQTVPHKLGSPN